jgi:hypothetical protein
MRYGPAILICCLIGGCADTTTNVAQEAANRCAAVGISARDPDFSSCMQAYALEAKQDAILNAYRETDSPRPAHRGRCGDGAC